MIQGVDQGFSPPEGRGLQPRLRQAIALLDDLIARQVAEIMQAPRFLRLEASWRGLSYLVAHCETGPLLKLRVLNVTKLELAADFARATEFDQSRLFKHVYESEFGPPDGEPYGALIGDYEFSADPADVELLRHLSNVASASFAPFISAASPSAFNLTDFRGLPHVRDPSQAFAGPKYGRWHALRGSEDSRYLCLTVPRVLARAAFAAEGTPPDARPLHEHHCWMNAAYVVGAQLAGTFAHDGWWSALAGIAGTAIEDLPEISLAADDATSGRQLEANLADVDAEALGSLGFLPLFQRQGVGPVPSIGTGTMHKPRTNDRQEAAADAATAARLPCVMALSRIAHYLKVMGREKKGLRLGADERARWLNRWLSTYAGAAANLRGDAQVLAPLYGGARITVQEPPGMLGTYIAIAWLRPWLGHAAMSSELRLVVWLPW